MPFADTTAAMALVTASPLGREVVGRATGIGTVAEIFVVLREQRGIIGKPTRLIERHPPAPVASNCACYWGFGEAGPRDDWRSLSINIRSRGAHTASGDLLRLFCSTALAGAST